MFPSTSPTKLLHFKYHASPKVNFEEKILQQLELIFYFAKKREDGGSHREVKLYSSVYVEKVVDQGTAPEARAQSFRRGQKKGRILKI
jgi:hypothetical protein